MTNIDDKNYEDIIKTAFLMLYPRTLTDIPYSLDIFNEVKKRFLKSFISEDIEADIKKAFTFEARYKLIDKMLALSGITQVLELASGFSQRGLIFSQKPNSIYVELDLPQMAEMKQEVLSNIASIPNNLHIVSGNALRTEDFNKVTTLFDSSKPVAIINEGLLRYLSFGEKRQVALNIKSLLEKFDGEWITCDITMKKFLEIQSRGIPGYDATLLKMSGKDFNSQAFLDESHAKKFFDDLGFDINMTSFADVQSELVSPAKVNCPKDIVNDLIKHAVVGVMKLKQINTESENS